MSEPRLLFLDIDGVLNDHTAYANGYCGIQADKVVHLNAILEAVPDLKIVLSSAWRYTLGTVGSIETLLCCHGVNCGKRVHGLTEPDEKTHGGPMPDFGDRQAWSEIGIRLRAMQIRKYVASVNNGNWVAIDDLPLDIEPQNFVQTNPDIGLTAGVANAVIECFHYGVI